MAAGKLYTGISLEGESLKIAVIKIANKRVQLLRIDKFQLLDKLESTNAALKGGEDFSDISTDIDEDVFDLDSALNDDTDILGEIDLDDDLIGDLDDDEVLGDIKDDIDLELDELESGDEIVDVDMMDETESPASNEIQLFNLLTSINPKRVDLGLNIPAGTAIFQVIKDVDFKEVKGKDLKVIIDDRLEALHGTSKDDDFYSYGIRDDGALVLSSIDEEPRLLGLVDRTSSFYRGKIFIGEILPDETILMGLVKANYELEDDGITCIIQFGETNSRVLFLKGSRLWLVSPMITEGTRSRKFLNTLFSKILFQLDTGEVPNLDRLIICNNSMGEEGISFFKERFPDVEVTEFNFSADVLDPGDNTLDSVAPFTTTIGAAVAASGFKKEVFSKISFLPKYVIDRQKIFKLQWHGILLLILIMVSFPLINEYWKGFFSEINNLENQISLIDTQIQSFDPTVNSYNRVNSQLSQIQDKLVLMNTLAENSITWSVNLDLINQGIEDIGGVWLTGITPGDRPNTLNIEGIARTRDKVSRVADIFANATLLDVTTSQIRERDVYNFSYTISSIVSNTDVYTPQSLQGLGDLTGD
jgi:Tfp pilus assembly protein PilN